MSDEARDGVSWRNVAVVAVAGAAAGAVVWLVWSCVRGKTGKGTKVLATGETYVGDLVNGMANGFGTAYTQGGEATGQWKDDRMIGPCTGFIHGAKLVGEAFEGPDPNLKPWKLLFTFENGVTFDFDGHMNMTTKIMSGQGVGRNPNGDLLCCGPCEGMDMHGSGCEMWDGDGHYVGQMDHGVREGEGKLESTNGNVYEGNWSNGLRVGRGVMRYADGQTYEGTWKNGQWEDGVMRSADGSCRTVFRGNIIKQ